MARSQPLGSVLVGVIVASVCFGVLATTGQTAAQETAVLARIDEAGTRTIIITEGGGGPGFEPATLERIAALSYTESALGVGRTLDLRNTALDGGGDPVPARIVFGPALPEFEVTQGRWPAGGEAIVGQQGIERLRMEVPSGAVATFDDRVFQVVGEFQAIGPLMPLASGLLIGAGRDDTSIRTLYVLSSSPDGVEPLLEAILEVISAADNQDASGVDRANLQVETSATLADVRRVVAGELGRYSRDLIIAALAAGLALTSVTVLASTAMRRRDFGRRRALGASRGAIIVLVLMQTAMAGLLGAAVGTIFGLIAVGQLAGAAPPITYVAAVGTLAVLVAMVAAVPPAAIAATRDPVRILRVP